MTLENQTSNIFDTLVVTFNSKQFITTTRGA